MSTDTNRQAVRHVLVVTLVLNLLVAIAKIIIGVMTGALAISADGLHSLIDASSNVAALVAHRLASRPADHDHPYGHRRIETLAALAIGAFLLVTAWEISTQALARLHSATSAVTLTPLAFIVMIATLVVNLFITHYETREGQRLHSELLLADAGHTRSDVLVTLATLSSMVISQLLPWSGWDTLAALVIVAFIMRAAWLVLKDAGAILADTAPYSAQELLACLEDVPNILSIVRVRSRGPQDAAQVDVDVQVTPQTTIQQTYAITDAITQRIKSYVAGLAEVEVHFSA